MSGDLYSAYQTGEAKRKNHKGFLDVVGDVVGGALVGLVGAAATVASGGSAALLLPSVIAGAGAALTSDVVGGPDQSKYGALAYNAIMHLTSPKSGTETKTPDVAKTAQESGVVPTDKPLASTSDRMNSASPEDSGMVMDPQQGDWISPEEYRRRLMVRGTGRMMGGPIQ